MLQCPLPPEERKASIIGINRQFAAIRIFAASAANACVRVCVRRHLICICWQHCAMTNVWLQYLCIRVWGSYSKCVPHYRQWSDSRNTQHEHNNSAFPPSLSSTPTPPSPSMTSTTTTKRSECSSTTERAQNQQSTSNNTAIANNSNIERYQIYYTVHLRVVMSRNAQLRHATSSICQPSLYKATVANIATRILRFRLVAPRLLVALHMQNGAMLKEN